ncbi:MAG TPA: WYL domain-containing protein [Candidatus Stercorousia faecigallinarum]|mgnify:FL=1|nr:WYL domain-containing protein [Candidatus Stercorousia faecigallinarum]
MKEFIKNQKVTYNLMSFTGYKALLLFSLLTEGPKSYEEICEYFFNHPYLREKISIDTLRVYINSLRRIGCEVKRFRGDDKISRYVITAHPFELKLSDEQIQSVIKIYKSIVKNMDVKELLSMERFFEKIGSYIKNDDFIADIRKISMLRDIDKKLLEDLLDCCDRKEQIVIQYNSPNSGEKSIELIADKIDSSNGKIYLYGTGFEYMQYGSFLVSRIKKINEIKIEKTIPENLKEFRITYTLECSPDKLNLADNEKIIEKHNNYAVIEMKTSNDFLAKQKLLEYGPICKVLEPESFKNDFIKLLKDMKAGYYCG